MIVRLIIFINILILFRPAVSMADIDHRVKLLGGQPFVAEDHELPYLPSYCRCRSKNEKIKWQRFWQSKGDRGRDRIHLHHYCRGLLMLSRLNRGLGTKSALLRTAEGEFNYMLKHSNPKFILLPEIHLKMGITQNLMDRDSKALQHFIQATMLKKNYVSAYVHIIDYYKKHHDFKNAIKTAKKGLKYSPNSKILKKELVEMESLSTAK